MNIHHLSIPAPVLERGFWLYAWRIETADGRELVYVGRTGDSSSKNAQSPFNRVSGHLGSNSRANALQRHLTKRGLTQQQCRRLDFITCGPIFPEGSTIEQRNERRDIVGALEKKLRDELVDAGYEVLNTVHCRMPLDPALWAEVRAAFGRELDRLVAMPPDSSRE